MRMRSVFRFYLLIVTNCIVGRAEAFAAKKDRGFRVGRFFHRHGRDRRDVRAAARDPRMARFSMARIACWEAGQKYYGSRYFHTDCLSCWRCCRRAFIGLAHAGGKILSLLMKNEETPR